MDFLYFLVASFSLCFMIVTSKIFSKIRNFLKVKSDFWGNIITCIQCMGFWCGFLLYSLIYFDLVDLSLKYFSPDFPFVDFIVWSLISSLFCVLGDSLIFKLNSNKIFLVSNQKSNDQESNDQ
jgi:hypothetical protein